MVSTQTLISELPTEIIPDIDFWDPENPRSLINIIHPEMARSLLEARAARPELFEMDETELYTHFVEKEQAATVTPTDNFIRMRFWTEYDYAQNRIAKLDLNRMLAGVISRSKFLNMYCKHTHKLAWMLLKPQTYTQKTSEALMFSIDRMRDLLAIPHINGNGQVNVKLAELKVKIFALLDLRVNGTPIQKNLNLHAHTSDKKIANDVMNAVEGLETDKMHARLMELRRQNDLLANGGIIAGTGREIAEEKAE